ncbi:MAG TPA: class I SAM-dependent methyltransferase [Opitutaceae bacterium]|nr:class I SAM-dependent methyltransferase [Opitutaceae bacterium]
MMRRDQLAIPWHFVRALRARRAALRLGLPGAEFDAFGRRLGARLALRGGRDGWRLLLQPVDFLRYYEFAFVAEALRGGSGDALDVSSPSLFSLWLAATRPEWRVRISNPDARDSAATAATIRRLGLRGVEVVRRDAQAVAAEGARYDAIWSISVFEHIAGDEADGRALQALARCLRPGGRLCLTVMTAPSYTDEFVDEDTYRLGLARTEKGYFFQRYYDEAALRSRLLAFVPELAVARLAWFGEIAAGGYAAFVERARRGYNYAWAVEEPWIAAKHYRWFECFSDMPGVGVACVELRRPATAFA